jgi:hypothetical protein
MEKHEGRWRIAMETEDEVSRCVTGGMCDLTPEILSAQVFAADGVTPVAGKVRLFRKHYA